MVDILLAVYNGEKYLEEQLESIAAQTYQNWRLVIRDDGSSDHSLAIAHAFQKKHPEKKIEIYVNEVPTKSAKGNFMRLLEDAVSEYVMFCDQDDVWLPEKVEKTLKAMVHCEKKSGTKDVPILVHGDLYVVDENLQIISDSMFRYQKLPKTTAVNQLLIQNSVTGCTVMINKKLQDMLKRASDTQAMVMHDYWAALIASVFGKIVFMKQPLIKYRQHGDNSVGAMNASGIRYMYSRFKAGKTQFRNRMDDTMRQAGAFCRIYAVELQENPHKKLIENYAKLIKSLKIQKITFCLSNKVMKYGIIRKIMQFVWS